MVWHYQVTVYNPDNTVKAIWLGSNLETSDECHKQVDKIASGYAQPRRRWWEFWKSVDTVDKHIWKTDYPTIQRT